MSEKVSFLIASFNSDQDDIVRTLESIANQKYSSIEVIFVDDGSLLPVCLKILEMALNGIPFKLLRNEKNLGLTKSLNIGLKNACGSIIVRLDVGDVNLPNRVKSQVQCFEDPEIMICFGGAKTTEINGSISLTRHVPSDRCADHLMRQNIIPHSAVAFRRQQINCIGGYNEAFKVTQDYELWTRAIIDCGYAVVSLDKILVLRQQNGASISTNRFFQQVYNGFKIRRKYCNLFINLGLTAKHFLISSFLFMNTKFN
tara:strand:+ start:2506 stop:3276 length:771 start_codon:yes stop_codon:yes gene_type:complete